MFYCEFSCPNLSLSMRKSIFCPLCPYFLFLLSCAFRSWVFYFSCVFTIVCIYRVFVPVVLFLHLAFYKYVCESVNFIALDFLMLFVSFGIKQFQISGVNSFKLDFVSMCRIKNLFRAAPLIAALFSAVRL